MWLKLHSVIISKNLCNHHRDVQHSGVETTLVQLIAHVIGGRELVKKYTNFFL